MTGHPSPPTWPAWRHPSTPAVALAVGACLLAYLLAAPPTLDLAAQVARATLFRDHGVHIWWPGWFAGTDLLGYSVLAPVLMAATGVRLAGALATLAASASGAALFGTARRPRLAMAGFVAVLLADLVAGRVTFVIGSAFAVVALLALQRRSRVGAFLAGMAASLGSPLAGLFLGLVLVAVAATDASRRRIAVLTAVAAAVPVAVTTVLFSSAAVMPFDRNGLWMPLIACLVLLVAVPNRLIRCTAVLFAIAVVVAYNVPSAVGSNVSRLAMLFTAPVLIGWGGVTRRTLAAALAALVPLVAWPALDLAGQLTRAGDLSSQRRYYAPLLAELSRLQQQSQAVGQPGRVEIVDPRTHWASVYIADRVPLARGWERQLDVANNPLFYTGTVTSPSYRAWLHQLAVRWVALPDAALDYAAQAEGQLVAGGLPYLEPIWSGPHWRLYAVSDPAPVVAGPATVVGLNSTGVDIRARAAGVVRVAVRYTPYLRVRGLGSSSGLTTCVEPAGSWTTVYLPAAGDYRLGAAWSLAGATHAESASC